MSPVRGRPAASPLVALRAGLTDTFHPLHLAEQAERPVATPDLEH